MRRQKRRFQSPGHAKLDAAKISQLELQWAFAFPGDTIAEAQPTIVDGRMLIGNRSGRMYALDTKTALLISPAADWLRSICRVGKSPGGRRQLIAAIAAGPVIVDGWVYIMSGYSKWGGLPGNVLLAFALPQSSGQD